MHNVWLIAKREYTERIRTRAFLLATILIPALLGGLVFGSVLLAKRSKSSSHIALVSSDAIFASDLKHALEHGKDSQMTVDVLTPSSETRAALERRLRGKGDLAGYLWVTEPAAGSERPAFAYVPRSAGDIATQTNIESAIREVLTRESLKRQNMSAAEIEATMAPVVVDTSSTGDTRLAFYAAYMFFFLMYMVIMLYGMNTARSIIEEKSSRVFEVLLATIKPDEMLAGKILGVGAVGLTQVAVWMVAVAALGAQPALLSSFGVSGHPVVTVWQIVSFIAYFLFGFLLYSSIAAALGAMTNSEQELQQLNMFLVIPLAFCMLMLVTVVNEPNSTLSRVVSLIPFCSPLLMNMRISLSHVAPWEIALSFLLMSLTILAVLWVASRIYRVGILMYGKKPNLPEIMRWLKYS